jgi:hypothetical protein
MAQIAFFQPRQFQTPENKMLLRYLPKSKSEGYKADIVEKRFSEELYVRYLALTLVHETYHYLPERHMKKIQHLIDYGVFDELAVTCETGLTDCYVSKGKFYYKNIEFDLPQGYIPRMRFIDEENNIFVEAFSSKGKRRVYQFMLNEKRYKWRRIDDKPPEFFVDF